MKALCLVVLSPVLIWLSFPETSLYPLTFIALIPFFICLDQSRTLKKSLLCGALFGALQCVFMGYWLFYALMGHYEKTLLFSSCFIFIAVIIPISIVYGVFGFLYSFMKKENLIFYGLTIPSLWITLDFLKETIPFLLPWANIGYAETPFSSFIQVADLGGIHLVSFVVVMINGAGLFFIKQFSGPEPVRIKCKRALAPGIILLALISIPTGYGFYKISRTEALESVKADKKITVTLAQGNFSLKERWSGMGFLSRLKTYMDLSQSTDSMKKRIIVWPETVLNSSTKIDKKLLRTIIVPWIGKNSLLITGGLRKSKNKKGVLNSAYLISGDGIVKWYDKNILLPYAEAAGTGTVLGGFYNAPGEFEQGNTPSRVETSLGRIGISICFECLYPEKIRESVAGGAGLLVNLSNDSWFGNSSMPRTHLYVARMRAIENRRYMLRAANSGITALISPYGKIIRRTKIFTRQGITGSAELMTSESVYVKFGGWIVYLALFILLFVFISLLFQPEE